MDNELPNRPAAHDALVRVAMFAVEEESAATVPAPSLKA